MGSTGQTQSPPKYIASPGNHDRTLVYHEAMTLWKDHLHGQTAHFGNDGQYFTFDFNNARFVILNSKSTMLTDEKQNKLLRKAIGHNPRTWLFVIWHHPIFSFGRSSYREDIHQQWGPSLYDAGCDLLITGHEHYYIRTKKLNLNGSASPPLDNDTGTTHIITGTGGAPLHTYDLNKYGYEYIVESHVNDYGYCEITVDHDVLIYKYRLTDGTVFDQAVFSPNPKPFFMPVPANGFTGELLQNTVKFKWPDVTHNKGHFTIQTDCYNIYRSTEFPLNTAALDSFTGITDTLFSDNPATIGNSAVHTYYWSRTIDSDRLISDYSQPFLAFDFDIITSVSTNLNFISMPVVNTACTTASALFEQIPGSDAISVWHAETQNYKQYIPGVPGSDFTLNNAAPFWTFSHNDTFFTAVGQQYNPQYHFVTTEATNFNAMFLPWEKHHLQTASDLMQDIPGCNSVVYFKADTQEYIQYAEDMPTNFNIQTAHPYLVNVENPVSWPDANAAKQRHQNLLTAASAVRAPHAAWGAIQSNSQVHVSRVNAWINSRKTDLLTQQSPGCQLSESHWIIQCAAFQSGWHAADTLHIDFCLSTGDTLSHHIQLTSEPVNRLNDLILAAQSLPAEFLLEPNFPNPFNQTTQFRLNIPCRQHIQLTIYNIQGRLVKTLLNKTVNPGRLTVQWQGIDQEYQTVTSGIYIARLQYVQGVLHRKITLTR